jgi:hypothetical protein
MASSDTNSVDTLPTILSAYAEQTRPLQILLLIYSVLGAICFPLLLVLVHLSTARSRRTPLFVLTMVDVILGIVVASWMVSILVSTWIPLFRHEYTVSKYLHSSLRC